MYTSFLNIQLTILQFILILLDASSIQQEHTSVQSVGTWIVKTAFVEAKRSFVGCCLGLHRKKPRVLWQGNKGGMKRGSLYQKKRFLLQIKSPPKILVIHYGGNSLGAITLFVFRETLKSDILKLHEVLLQKQKLCGPRFSRFLIGDIIKTLQNNEYSSNKNKQL